MSRPELALRALNGGKVMGTRKKTREGWIERLQRLEGFFPSSATLFAAVRNQYSKTRLADDDIVDALGLAVTASLPGGQLQAVPASPQFDATGLPMKIIFASIQVKNRLAV